MALPRPIRPINTKGLSADEEFGALVQATPKLDDPLGSADVEQVPENMVIAKIKPTGPVEKQLARIMEEEFAAAVAGLEDILFEFDSWQITEAGKDVLQKNANLLQEDSNLTLLIEGHCDQRGTNPYKLVPGKKRAIAIRDYHVHLGVEPGRLFVITYGKEKPFATLILKLGIRRTTVDTSWCNNLEHLKKEVEP